MSMGKHMKGSVKKQLRKRVMATWSQPKRRWPRKKEDQGRWANWKK